MSSFSTFFFFNDTATTEIYTLSLHDALPICARRRGRRQRYRMKIEKFYRLWREDRKSTRLNSSHANISYAVFGLKKKKRGQKRLDPDPLHRNADRSVLPHIDVPRWIDRSADL